MALTEGRRTHARVASADPSVRVVDRRRALHAVVSFGSLFDLDLNGRVREVNTMTAATGLFAMVRGMLADV